MDSNSLIDEVNWRPQLLCMYKFHREDTTQDGGFHHDDVLFVAQQVI